MARNKIKIIAIVGQTATGKSGLAVEIAKKIGGEVISCDSRQVYKKLNIGTGKITKKEMQNIPHHMLDVTDPKNNFSVVKFQKLAKKTIKDIYARNKIPILCGGTGFYIDSVIYDLDLPNVPPDNNLRKKLAKKTTEELFSILKKLDAGRANAIDPKNKIRIIRAIEIAKSIGRVPKINKKNKEYDVLLIGVKLSDKELKEKIKKRLLDRIKRGMVAEAKKLKRSGLSYKRMRELGLEYKYLADFLQNKISKKDFIDKLNTSIWHYAKRQKTWFKKNKNIKWFHPQKDIKNIEKEIENFLYK